MASDTIIEDARWERVDLSSIVDACMSASLIHLGLRPEDFELVVMGCDDARIAALNGDFRDKPRPTNVLSWPSEERGAEIEGDRPALPPPGELGDIAIAYDTCVNEAQDAGIPLEQHTRHLIVHATLHLLGYDHVRDGDATVMEALEVEILGKMGLPDPYMR